MLESYIKRAYLSYGEIAEKLAPNFRYLIEDLKKSGMRYTLIEYLSLAIFVSLITFTIELPVITMLLSFFMHVVFAIFLSFLISGAGAVLIFFSFTAYPKAQVNNLAAEIERGLPFSVSYMTATASADSPPVSVFKSIVKLGDYPELVEQAKNIIRDVEGLGMDIISALKREAKRTPSKQFKELLSGMESTIVAGGDLSIFLKNRAQSLFNEYQKKIKTYGDMLSIIIEIYIVLIILGPVFFTLLSSVMSVMGTSNIIEMQFFIIFLLTPAISIALALFINLASP